MRKIGVQEIEDMATGAAVLAAGGGGDPYVGKLMAQQAVRTYGEVTLLDVSEIPDDGLYAAANMIGAPTVLVEKIPSGLELQNSFQQLEKTIGGKLSGVVPLEAGGINSMLPLVLAAVNHLPLIDCDGMGRAFPELQMVTWNLFDIPCVPAVVSDEKGNSVSVNAVSNLWAERLCRTATNQMGGSCYMSCYSMTGKQLRETSILGTSTKCENIGRIIRESKNNRENIIPQLLSYLNGYTLFKGKITDVFRRTVGGFARGEAQLEGLAEYKDQSLNIKFQNENLIAQTNDGRILCTTPDLIVMLDLEASLPITTEGLKYGARVIVIGIPCSHLWRSEKGITVAGPEYFGYSIPYIPVEKRMNIGCTM